jgi:mannose-6-phosphate isomerase-like protein (cupin superfamily)
MAKFGSYETGQSDVRPWGDWEVLDCGAGYVVKRIRVTPGGRLSLQRHQHRAEQWTVVSGVARVTVGEQLLDLGPGQSVAVPHGAIHRMENFGAEDMVLIEVQHGPLLSEDDIERLEDVYGRS